MGLIQWLLCCVDDEDSTTTEFNPYKYKQFPKEEEYMKSGCSEQQTQSQSVYISPNPLLNPTMTTMNSRRRQPQPFVEDVQTLGASQKKFSKVGKKTKRMTKDEKKDKKTKPDKKGKKDTKDKKDIKRKETKRNETKDIKRKDTKGRKDTKDKKGKKDNKKKGEKGSDMESGESEAGLKIDTGSDAESEAESEVESNQESDISSEESESESDKDKKDKKGKKATPTFDDGTGRERNEVINLDWENKVLLTNKGPRIKQYRVPKSLAIPLMDTDTSGLYGRQGLKFLDEKSFIKGLQDQDAMSKDSPKKGKDGKVLGPKKQYNSNLKDDRTGSVPSGKGKPEEVKGSKHSGFKTEHGNTVSYSVQSACSTNQSIAPSTRMSVEYKYKEPSTKAKRTSSEPFFKSKASEKSVKETTFRVKTSFDPKAAEKTKSESSKSSEKPKETGKKVAAKKNDPKPEAKPAPRPAAKPAKKADTKPIQRKPKSTDTKAGSKIRITIRKSKDKDKKKDKKSSQTIGEKLGQSPQLRPVVRGEEPRISSIERNKPLVRQASPKGMTAFETRANAKQKPKPKDILEDKDLGTIREDTIKEQSKVRSEIDKWEAKSRALELNPKMSSINDERSFAQPTIQHSSTAYQTGNGVSYSAHSAHSKASSWTSFAKENAASNYKDVHIPSRTATLEMLKKLTGRSDEDLRGVNWLRTPDKKKTSPTIKSPDKKPEDKKRPTSDKKPGDKKKPTSDKKPDDKKKPMSDKKPDDKKKPTSDKKPDDKKRPTSDKKPEDKKKSDSEKSNESFPKVQSDKTDFKKESPKKIKKDKTPKSKSQSVKTKPIVRSREKTKTKTPKPRTKADKKDQKTKSVENKDKSKKTPKINKKLTPNKKHQSLDKTKPNKKTPTTESSNFNRYTQSANIKPGVLDSQCTSNVVSNANDSNITHPTVLVVEHTDDTGKMYEKVMSVDIPDSTVSQSGGGIKIGAVSKSGSNSLKSYSIHGKKTGR